MKPVMTLWDKTGERARETAQAERDYSLARELYVKDPDNKERFMEMKRAEARLAEWEALNARWASRKSLGALMFLKAGR